MKFVSVIQHTSADYLGYLEDHLEGRQVRFTYFRPFTEDGGLPIFNVIGDGLVLLGGGPWGAGGGRDVPTLAEEVSLVRACFMTGVPVIGFGLGAQILALAADGKVEPAPLTFKAGWATRISDDALGGYLPERFPNVVYMRDRPVPPDYAKILATDEDGYPAVFQIGENMFGFSGHPGMKRAMVEDLIMEFEEAPENPGPELEKLGKMRDEIEDSLLGIMTGLVQKTGLIGLKKD